MVETPKSAIPRWQRIVLLLSILVGLTLVFSAVASVERHQYSQLWSILVGIVVGGGGIVFVGKILRDHELLQERLHETNEELRASRTLLHSTFDRASAGMVTFDPSFRIIDMNESLAASLGCSRDETRGRSVTEFIHPDELRGTQMALRSVLNGEITGTARDIRLRTKNNEWKWYAAASSIVRNAEGGPAYFITQALDIADRLEMEAELREQQELHRRLLSALGSMGECVIVGEGDHVVWANDAYAKLAGYEPEEMIGMKSRDLIADEVDHAQFLIRNGLMLEGLESDQLIQGDLLCKDGTRVPIEGSTYGVSVNGGFQRISVVRDVSDRRRWEQAITERSQELLAANDELREANKLKTDLIGMLSHEIGQPLTTIVGYSEMLSDDWESMEDEMRRSGIERIDSASHNLANLVDEMLTMIRADAGVLHATLQDVNVRSAVQSAAAAVRDVMPAPIEIDVPEDFEVSVDANHFRQVLINLFTNAKKYGQAPFLVRAESKADWVRVEVIDNGDGVPADFVPHLFSRFSRASNEITKSAKGTGLGLFIVSILLGASSATIHYERNEPNGSRFVIDMVPAHARQLDSANR